MLKKLGINIATAFSGNATSKLQIRFHFYQETYSWGCRIG